MVAEPWTAGDDRHDVLVALVQGGADPELAWTATEAALQTVREWLAPRPPWMRDALCAEPAYEPEMFFARDTAPARAVCARCLVAAECAEYGAWESAGVWGGIASRDRLPTGPPSRRLARAVRTSARVADDGDGIPRQRVRRSDAGIRKVEPKPCIVCGWRPATAKQRCNTCYLYRWKTGRDRSEELVVAEARRAFDRMVERKAWGNQGPRPGVYIGRLG